jgi:Ras GTPase-activating-like protein IQGAP2/3
MNLNFLQRAVYEVNREQDVCRKQLAAVQRVNDAVIDHNEELVYEALCDPILSLSDLFSQHMPRYLSLLQRHLEQHEELTLQAIQESVELCHRQFEVMKKKCSAVVAINLIILDKDEEIDEEQLLEMLQTDVLELPIIEGCIHAYIDSLLAANQNREVEDNGWIFEVISDDHSMFYFDTDAFTAHWVPPNEEIINSASSQYFLSSVEIGECIQKCTEAYNKVEEWKKNDHLLIKIQAMVRMFIQRKRYTNRLNYLNDQKEATTLIQSYYRGFKVRKEILAKKKLWSESTREIITIQSFFRMLLARLRYCRRRKHYKDNEDAIVKIQAWWRVCFVRNNYQGLNTARLSAIRHFVDLLDQTSSDMTEIEEISTLKKKIIRKIRDNEELENGLGSMDVKIGLLIRNRISLEEAEKHLKKLKRHKSSNTVTNGTLRRMNKETRALIQHYETLFTLLQTDPSYLSKLLFCMNTVNSNKFVQSAVFALFDWAQNRREEYLLLQLFRMALQEEINMKVTQPKDLMTANPLVIKLIVNFNRGVGMSFQGSNSEQVGKKSLRDILHDRVFDVDQRSKDLLNKLEWNPRSVYNSLIQNEEMETGVKSERNHNASVEECLKSEEVLETMKTNLKTLSLLVEGFLDAIVSSVSALPYGLRYLAKCLFYSLKEKFPDEDEEDLLLNVGHLVYYR